jgi:UDP-N-acetylglucosamine transferase subunit ALG13
LSTFVSLGNALQPFARLLEGIGRLATQLPQPVIVQHGHTPFRDRACLPAPFLGMDEFIEHIHNADLLIMHAGAGSIMHAVEAGKVPVVMPRRAAFGEHVNDHQVEFAQALAETGKVVIANTPDDLSYAVEKAMARQKLTQARHGSADEGLMSPLTLVIERVLSDYERQFSSES